MKTTVFRVALLAFAVAVICASSAITSWACVCKQESSGSTVECFGTNQYTGCDAHPGELCEQRKCLISWDNYGTGLRCQLETLLCKGQSSCKSD
jgi:hypothetical protein